MGRKVIMETGKNKRIAVIYDEKVDPQTGIRRLKKRIFRSSEEADLFLEYLENNKKELLQQGQEFPPITLGRFAKEWFNGEYALRVTPVTLKKSKYYLDKHILPNFNDRLLHEVTVIDIERLYVQKQKQQYSHEIQFMVF
jgi:hypothetical protein